MDPTSRKEERRGSGFLAPPSLSACLSYYREQPEWLDRAVRSLAILGVTDLVTADGGYAAYPDATASGTPAEREAIYAAAEDVGIRVEIFVPHKPWPTEMDKRSWLFARSRQRGAHWHLVFDADYLVAEGFDLKPMLRDGFGADVGVITLRHHARHGEAYTATMMPLPMVFKALPGLHVTGHHAHYVTADGRCLWGFEATVPRVAIDGVVIDHLSCFRDPERLEDQQTYYQRRDESKLEWTGAVA